MENENIGKGYTGIAGKGIDYINLEKDRNNTIQRITQTDVAIKLMDFEIKKTKERYDNKEKFITDEYIKKKDGLKQHYSTSFITRLLELYKLMEQDKRLGYIIWAIMGLFIMIETSPVIVKLMTSKSAYDIYIQEEYDLAKTKYNEYRAIKVNEFILNREFKEELNISWKESLISILPDWNAKMEEIYKQDISNQNIHSYINAVIGSYNNKDYIQLQISSTQSNIKTQSSYSTYIIRLIGFILALVLGRFLYIEYGKETVMSFSSIIVIIILFSKYIVTGILDTNSINETTAT